MQVYADNAATTQISDRALAEMIKYYSPDFQNPSSLHTYGQAAADALADARERIAKCLNCDPRGIVFTSGGSEADNQAILSAVAIGARKGKKHIISSAIEHHAVLHTLEALKKYGYEITLLPVDEKGLVSVESVRNALREDTALVTIMFANNEIGTIQPIAEIGRICREKKVIFHTDAVQAVGHIPVDVESMNIDMMSVAAHKFHGPKGVGLLYCRRGLTLKPLINGGAQEKGKRAGTENLPAIMGMAAALE
ncbi:MAG: cysteine desulfurase, partial [Ruminococcaceae bacterium]|nr:cysteine desulfurase [Oscillospiraceae bacterium]